MLEIFLTLGQDFSHFSPPAGQSKTKRPFAIICWINSVCRRHVRIACNPPAHYSSVSTFSGVFLGHSSHWFTCTVHSFVELDMRFKTTH